MKKPLIDSLRRIGWLHGTASDADNEDASYYCEQMLDELEGLRARYSENDLRALLCSGSKVSPHIAKLLARVGAAVLRAGVNRRRVRRDATRLMLHEFREEKKEKATSAG